MKVSIITATYNCENTITTTINSVLSQTYDNIEYIIIDGGSKDSTLDIISNYKDSFKNGKIITIISERDSGVYDAMNKGINLSSGDIIAFINSDDYYVSDNIIEEMISIFSSDERIDGVYANIYYVKRYDTEHISRRWITGTRSSFIDGWHPAHPAFFVKKNIYDKYGRFNLQYKLAADFELMLRFIEVHHINIKYYPHFIIKMREGGMTNNSIRNIIKQNIECIKAFRNNGIKINMITYPVKRIYSKVLQFLN